MRRIIPSLLGALVCCAFNSQLSTTFAQGTAFTYQGRLSDNGNPYTGSAEFQPTLWNAVSGGSQVAANTPASVIVGVTNGLFVLPLDFGANFPGADRWLQLEVRTVIGPFSTLSPRQKLTPAPYAMRAQEAGTVPDASITSVKLADGAVVASKITPGAVSQLGTPNGAATNTVQVSNDGLVGVGIANPQAGLDVAAGRAVRKPLLIFEGAPSIPPAYVPLNFNQCVAVSGNLLAVASSSSSAVTLMDVSNPSVPVFRSQLVDGTNGFNRLAQTRRLALNGNLLAISARNENAVTLVDVSNPAAPVKLVELVDGQAGWNRLAGVMGVTLAGNILAITAEFDDAVTLADVSNPALPVKLAEIVNGVAGFTNLFGPVSVLISSNKLFVGSWNGSGVTIADISAPTNPVVLATLKHGVGGYQGLAGADGLAISGNLLAISANDSDAITLVDVSQPASPVKLAEFPNGRDVGGEGAQQLAFYQNLLGVADLSESTFTVYDVSVPAAPRVALRYRNGTGGITSLVAAYGVSLIGTNFCVGNGTSLMIVGTEVTEDKAAIVTSGRVGIGTSNPQAELHVFGDAIIEGNLNGNGAGLTNLAIDSAEIVNGTIVNIDISAIAAIADTKLATISTAGKVTDSALSANVARRSGGNAFTGNQTVTSGSVGIGGPALAGLTVSGSGPFNVSGAAAVTLSNTVAGQAWEWHALDNGRLQLADHTVGASRIVVQPDGSVGIGTASPTNKLHVAGGITCTALLQTSDRNAKENFTPVSPLEVLDKVAALPITTWNFKTMKDGRHMGPMAQDFYAAFGLGGGDTTITSIDPDGVALAAIQGLNQKVANETVALRAENTELKTRLEKLEQILNKTDEFNRGIESIGRSASGRRD